MLTLQPLGFRYQSPAPCGAGEGRSGGHDDSCAQGAGFPYRFLNEQGWRFCQRSTGGDGQLPVVNSTKPRKIWQVGPEVTRGVLSHGKLGAWRLHNSVALQAQVVQASRDTTKHNHPTKTVSSFDFAV